MYLPVNTEIYSRNEDGPPEVYDGKWDWCTGLQTKWTLYNCAALIIQASAITILWTSVFYFGYLARCKITGGMNFWNLRQLTGQNKNAFPWYHNNEFHITCVAQYCWATSGKHEFSTASQREDFVSRAAHNVFASFRDYGWCNGKRATKNIGVSTNSYLPMYHWNLLQCIFCDYFQRW